MLDNIIDSLCEWIVGLMQNFGNFLLNIAIDNIVGSVDIVSDTTLGNPKFFGGLNVVANVIKGFAENGVMPVAYLLLSFIFCYELINLVTERNNMAEFDFQSVFWLVIKTAGAIIITRASFDICMAFFDAGDYIIQQAGVTGSPTFTEIEALRPENNGGNDMAHPTWYGLTELGDPPAGGYSEIVGTAAFGVVMMLVMLIGSFIAYVVIMLQMYSRIIAIFLYISVSPLPFCTLLFQNNFMAEVGRNYLKNLMAYMLQLFLILILVALYARLLIIVTGSLGTGNMLQTTIMILCCCFAVVVGMNKTLDLAKSVMGAS